MQLPQFSSWQVLCYTRLCCCTGKFFTQFFGLNSSHFHMGKRREPDSSGNRGLPSQLCRQAPPIPTALKMNQGLFSILWWELPLLHALHDPVCTKGSAGQASIIDHCKIKSCVAVLLAGSPEVFPHRQVVTFPPCCTERMRTGAEKRPPTTRPTFLRLAKELYKNSVWILGTILEYSISSYTGSQIFNFHLPIC